VTIETRPLEWPRARRMRAERNAKEAIEAGNPIPEDIMATLRELGSPVAGGS